MKTAVLVVMMFVAVGAGAQSCPNGFTASGPCGIAIPGQASQAFQVASPTTPAPGLSGSAVDLIPIGASHWGAALNYATKVNVQAFTATFTFVPNGWAIAFVLENNTNSAASGGSGRGFGAGAGCEAGFYQGFTSNNLSTNNIFAMDFSSQDVLAAGASSPFAGSSVQVYTAGQSPCNPNLGGGVPYVGLTKISTAPVPLTLSTGAANGCLLGNGCSTTTGDTYSAAITYDGSTVKLTLADVTHPNGTFTHSWTGVNIPALVGASTAWLGITAGSGDSTMTVPLLVKSLVYTVGAPPPPPATLAIPAQSIPLSITTAGTPITGTITIPAQTVTLPQP